MNENKLNKLFAAAKGDIGPKVPADFAENVARAAGSLSPLKSMEPVSVWDQLNSLFPRIGLAAAVVIVLCLAADWSLTAAGLPGVNDGAAQVTSQYLFTPEDL